MSQENVEVMRATFEVWNAGDMDALRELYDPNVTLWLMEDFPEPGPHVGLKAVMRQWKQQREAFDADTADPISDFIDIADHVLVRFVWRGRGLGPDSDMEVTQVITVRKGKVFLLEHFWDHAEALETVGLSE
jgi:ketosteroid isomerase-like protein